MTFCAGTGRKPAINVTMLEGPLHSERRDNARWERHELMNASTAAQGINRAAHALARLPPFYVAILKVVGIAICVWLVLLPQLTSSFEASRRYSTAAGSDWNATNVWLKSVECTRQTGAWLVLCEGGKLIPISDRALADDPGHALILAWWARLTDRTITLVDVVRLNLILNLSGLVLLAAILLCLRAYFTTLVLITLGPYVFLEWLGTSPHWALIGISAMQVVLPLALIARRQQWLPPAATTSLVVVGVLTLSLASLVREVISQMTLVVTLAVAAWVITGALQRHRRFRAAIIVALLALLASQTARLTVIARDTIYDVEPAQLVATHGMAHTLYIGLGVVENKFGIRYDDTVGKEAAETAAPDVKYLSRDYFRVMWALYLNRWAEDPMEVSRIYLEKLSAILGNRILDSAPPPLMFFALVIAIHWLSNDRRASCGSSSCDRRLAINLVCLAFAALFMVQAVLAHPTRFYSSPIGVFMLVTLGITIENIGASSWRTFRAKILKVQ